jgi:hypothetical protein
MIVDIDEMIHRKWVNVVEILHYYPLKYLHSNQQHSLEEIMMNMREKKQEIQMIVNNTSASKKKVNEEEFFFTFHDGLYFNNGNDIVQFIRKYIW